MLAELVFADPHLVRGTGRRHAVVAAEGGDELPSAPRSLQVEVVGAGTVRDLRTWLAETWATSLVVVHDGEVVHEWYLDGHGAQTLFLGASMTKSVLAVLVERALDLDTAVVDLVPELAASGYAGTRVRDLLTMTSGVDWVEDHRDPDGLATRLVGAFTAGGDSRSLLREVRPGVAPGTRWTYCTADSQVLDWVRERATGLSFADDLTALWRDAGCASDAVVALDDAGVAMAGGGLAATARDWARLVPLATPDAARPAHAFTRVGRLPSTLTSFAGFGRHWWPMDDDGHRVTADGSRGQFACTDLRTGTVVVKTSLWPYADPWVDRQARDLTYLGLHALLDALT